MSRLPHFSLPRIQMILALTPIANKALADAAHVSQASISRYLSGKVVPSAAVAERIARVLGFEAKDAPCLFERITWEEAVAALVRTNFIPGVQR